MANRRRKKNPDEFERGFAAGYEQGLEECGPVAGITGYFDRSKKLKGLRSRSERAIQAAAERAAADARRREEESVKRAKRAIAELTGEAEPEENPRSRAPADPTAARELVLYATNTYELYPQRQAIETALRRKRKQGKYRSDLAPKAWKYWMDAAAKRYAKEFASPNEWNRIFTPATRELAAAEMAEIFEDEEDIQSNPRKRNPRPKKRRMNPIPNEARLSELGGPVAWGVSSAEEAADQMHEYGGVEGAYHVYLGNVEDTLNEFGFDLSTDRGYEVITAAQRAFDKRYLELTGFDFWADLRDMNPRARKATKVKRKKNPSKRDSKKVISRYLKGL